MFCALALAVLDSLVCRFEIEFMAALFEIFGDLRFEVVEKIADGRMGAVFRAYQIGSEGFAKEVAIKVMHERFAMQRQFIENFIGEGKLVADLIHPQLVLESPHETFVFRFNPVNPNLVAAGCITGQVLLWDLTEAMEKLRKKGKNYGV